MKKFSMIAAGVITVSLMISGCAAKSSDSAKNDSAMNKAGDTIKLGWIGPLTGPTATDGTHSRDAAIIAIEQYNKAGGIQGKKVELIAEDDQGKPEEALKGVQKLINNDKVVAIVGGAYSGPRKRLPQKSRNSKFQW
ncbi:ABC transporter substrate-binding protein [Paenibacillus alginolyticus]|uniref:ABC transporter substrate-binding protein n=1 Tax=Paenibacillus alginolyticus TaxID=59839 RepID=UPI0035E4250E